MKEMKKGDKVPDPLFMDLFSISVFVIFQALFYHSNCKNPGQ
jgi:hypothetical protein